MDETDLLRPKVLQEDSAPITYAADGINIEDDQYSALREDLEADVRDFESPTWSLAVDQQYLKSFSKEAIKRQDVIHELVQTEINHVRTLKLMLHVYCCAVQHSLPKDEVQLDRLFPQLKHLLTEHQSFLDRLKQRRKDCLEPGSQQNYCMTRIGDLLKSQFSDKLQSRLLDGYGVFCSRHTDVVNYYKDLMQNHKKFQNLMKKIGQLAIVRRLGVPEGILLITQRITKYPVLVERLIKNTEADTVEYEDLVCALDQIKKTISQVDERVHHYEKLRDLVTRLEPKSQGRMSNGQVLRREDLIQPGRKVLFEGLLSWRSQNKPKVSDVLLVLLSDLLLLLQEKDQKLIFASLDGKPAVLSLQGLIVRESAQSDRMMFLISASGENAELYEFHASSREERSSWRQQVWQAIDSFSHVSEDYEEEVEDQEEVWSEKLRVHHARLSVADAQIAVLLHYKLQLFTEIAEMLMDSSTLPKHLLLNGTSAELQQGAQLLHSAIADVEGLQQLLAGESDPPPLFIDSVDSGAPVPSRRVNTITDFPKSDGGPQDSFRTRTQRPNSDPQLRDLYLSSLELSADDDDRTPAWHSPPPAHISKHQLCDTVARLTQMLYSLQAVVAHQDSEVELSRAALAERPARNRGNGLMVQEKHRHLEKQREELQELQRVYNQQKQEQAKWEQERQRHLQESQGLLLEINQWKEERASQEAWLAVERDALARSREEYQQDLERLREATRTVEKQREKLEEQEQQLKKSRKHNTISNPGASLYQDPAQGVSSAGELFLSPKVHVRPSLSQAVLQEHPPQVPPRKESISVSLIKQDVPIQLVSTTNQSQKTSLVQQQIPTKLAISKGKEKEKGKGKSSHHRTKSADIYIPPEHVLNTKPPSYPANTHASRKPSHASTHSQLSHRKVKDSSTKEDVYYC